MNLGRIAWRYLWSRPLVTALTLVAVALGAALIASVLTLRRETERTFLEESSNFDLVVGAKGSPLQLVLSSVYHLDIPTGNIPYSEYEKLTKDPRITSAIPIGLGDNYRGYRIVGTTDGFFAMTRREPGTLKPVPMFAVEQGRLKFEDPFDVVVGSQVAAATGLRIGDKIVGTHGIMALAGSEAHAEFPYTVVGIMAPSGTSNDRAVFTKLDAVWKIHDREEEIHRGLFAPKTESADAATSATAPAKPGWAFAPTAAKKEREVTAVLVQLKVTGMRLWLADEIKKNTNAMAAIPIDQMQRLYMQVLEPMEKTLLVVAYLVVVVAALSVLTTLYQAAERRRRDIAVMRCLGATPAEVFLVVLLEAFFVSVLGVVAGWLLGHGGVAVAAHHLAANMGLAISPWATDRIELSAIGIVAIVGIVAGIVPATLAYRRSAAVDLSLS